MAKFCTGCGNAIEEGKKFCSGCGSKVEAETPAYAASAVGIPQHNAQQAQEFRQQPPPVPPQQVQQPLFQPQPYAAQPQYSYQPSAPVKKKSKLKIILPIALLSLIGIAVVVFFVVLPGMMNKMAERDFYNIATNDVPTVKYVLGEKRTVTGISTATRLDGFQEQVVTYKSEEGENPQQDMLTYATAICDDYGFYSINDNDFSKSTGKNFRFAKESKMEGNLIIVQLDYDRTGYLVTLLHGEGTLNIPAVPDRADASKPEDSSSKPEEPSSSGSVPSSSSTPSSSSSPDPISTAGPWVGMWRREAYDGIALYEFNADGTVRTFVFYTDGNEDETLTGKYNVSDDKITMFDVVYNGESVAGEFPVTFEINGDTAIFNGETNTRVPQKDVVAVLADPRAPYPPGSGETSNGDMGSLTKDIFETLDSGIYHIKMKGVSGDSTGYEIEVYVKGDTVSMYMSAEGLSVRMVMKDNKTYTIMEDFKMVIITDADPDENMPGVGDVSNLTYVGEGSGSFAGKTYKYDEYRSPSGSQCFYYVDGGALKGIRTISDGTTTEMEITALDKNIPNDVFDIPVDYEVSDQTTGG